MRDDIRDMVTLIDGPGDYVTRDGKLVEIYDVKEPTGQDVTEFLAKGSVHIPKPSGAGHKSKYSIWHVSGRQYTFAESEHDIVGKWV